MSIQTLAWYLNKGAEGSGHSEALGLALTVGTGVSASRVDDQILNFKTSGIPVFALTLGEFLNLKKSTFFQGLRPWVPKHPCQLGRLCLVGYLCPVPGPAHDTGDARGLRLRQPDANCERVGLQKELRSRGLWGNGGDWVWLQQAFCLAGSFMNITGKFL